MTDLTVEELERVRAEATQGEWVADLSENWPIVADENGEPLADTRHAPGDSGLKEGDAIFIAYAANAWPALVEAVRERDRLRAALVCVAQDIGRAESNDSGHEHFEASQERRQPYWREVAHMHAGRENCQRCGLNFRDGIHLRITEQKAPDHG
jgi:hypothetical protein